MNSKNPEAPHNAALSFLPHKSEYYYQHKILQSHQSLFVP